MRRCGGDKGGTACYGGVGDLVRDATPVGVGVLFLGRPRVGLRGAVQPWAGGRNPVGIGGLGRRQGRDACLLRDIVKRSLVHLAFGVWPLSGESGDLYGNRTRALAVKGRCPNR